MFLFTLNIEECFVMILSDFSIEFKFNLIWRSTEISDEIHISNEVKSK